MSKFLEDYKDACDIGAEPLYGERTYAAGTEQEVWRWEEVLRQLRRYPGDVQITLTREQAEWLCEVFEAGHAMYLDGDGQHPGVLAMYDAVGEAISEALGERTDEWRRADHSAADAGTVGVRG